MEPLHRTSTVITWKEYKKFHKTDSKYMTVVLFFLLAIQISTLIEKDLDTPPFLLVLLSIPLTLGIYFLMPVFLLKKEYRSYKILHDIKLDYAFYETFFSVASTIGTECYSYEQMQTIETNTNVYIELPGDRWFILEKANCTPEFLKFLFSRHPEKVDRSQVLQLLQERQPELPEPFLKTHLMTRSSDTLLYILKFSHLKKTNNCTALPAVLLSGTLGILLLLDKLLKLVRFFKAGTVLSVALGIVFALLAWKRTQSKEEYHISAAAGNSSDKSIRADICFYDDFLQLTCPPGLNVTYYYNQLYKIHENEHLFLLQLTKDTFVVVEKKNCSPELLDFIQTLKRNCSQFVWLKFDFFR